MPTSVRIEVCNPAPRDYRIGISGREAVLIPVRRQVRCGWLEGHTVLSMPVEYLSVEQEVRYGRFAGEPSPGELEQFSRLDSEALGARARRRRGR